MNLYKTLDQYPTDALVVVSFISYVSETRSTPKYESYSMYSRVVNAYTSGHEISNPLIFL